MADWSDLTNDVLEYIARLLSFSDHYLFSAVCRNWRSVSKWRWYPPAPQLPWLVLDEESDTSKRKFYSLSEDKHYSIDIPELHGCYICGSSHGWLFAVDIKITGILINPFTRECYELPPFPAYGKNVDVTTLTEKVPSDYIEGPRDYTFEEMQLKIVFKAILSHDPKKKSDFTAMILFGEFNTPAFWRPGDLGWTVVVGQEGSMSDVVYFKGNFYVLSWMNVLRVVDFEPEPKLREVGPEIRVWYHSYQNYLMDFNGELLLINRLCETEENGQTITVDFDVIEPDLENNRIWYWYDFDDLYAIFLGRNSSIFVHSNDFSMCKKNGIYFTHLTETIFSPAEFGCHDLGVYDMKDESISKFFSLEVFPPPVGSPIWLTPNPL
ncbi:F-box family protein [Rhynchospora pubera]|uniref:F-box family protein n=1 Tax=Rhynchospora pubera TaxID=906938 RepID=A0AAV8EV35_9POAL|nr:F-box family protein [Rhynchospora pubera]